MQTKGRRGAKGKQDVMENQEPKDLPAENWETNMGKVQLQVKQEKKQASLISIL